MFLKYKISKGGDKIKIKKKFKEKEVHTPFFAVRVTKNLKQ